MNADWRYDDGKLHERQICLTCLIHNNIPINRNVYEFCNHVVSNGIIIIIIIINIMIIFFYLLMPMMLMLLLLMMMVMLMLLMMMMVVYYLLLQLSVIPNAPFVSTAEGTIPLPQSRRLGVALPQYLSF